MNKTVWTLILICLFVIGIGMYTVDIETTFFFRFGFYALLFAAMTQVFRKNN